MGHTSTLDEGIGLVMSIIWSAVDQHVANPSITCMDYSILSRSMSEQMSADPRRGRVQYYEPHQKVWAYDSYAQPRQMKALAVTVPCCIYRRDVCFLRDWQQASL